MDGQQYYAAVKRLGLRPSAVPNVYVSGNGDIHSVPDPAEYTSEQRVEIVEKLKELMGIMPSEDR